MKKYLTTQGKTAIAIIIGGVILSTGVFTSLGHMADAMVQQVLEQAYDGGAGGGGYVPPAPTVTRPTTPATTQTPAVTTLTAPTVLAPLINNGNTSGFVDGCIQSYSNGLNGKSVPMACDSSNWPRLGETKDLAWCANDSVYTYITKCEGTDLVLYREIATSYTTTETCEEYRAQFKTVTDLCNTGISAFCDQKAYFLQNPCTPGTKTTYTYEYKVAHTLKDGCGCSEPNACNDKTCGIKSEGLTLTQPIINVPNFGDKCDSPKNFCNVSASSTIGCDGVCIARTAPPLPTGFGDKCTATNSNGKTKDYVIGCDGKCGPPPPEDTCTVSNSCRTASNSGIYVNGVCNATTPPDPANLGKDCQSSANDCAMTNSGTYQCDGSCSAVVPSNDLCPVACVGDANSCGDRNSGTTTKGVKCPVPIPAERDVFLKIGKCEDPICGPCEELDRSNYTCKKVTTGSCKTCGCRQYLDNKTYMCVDSIIPPGLKYENDTSCKLIPVVPAINGVCSKTVVDDCISGGSVDTPDSNTKNLWTCKGTTVTYTDGGVTKTDKGTDANCSMDIIFPEVTVSPTTNSIKDAGPTTFRIFPVNATSCKIYKDGNFVRTANNTTSSTYTSDSLSVKTTFRVDCTNGAKTASATHSVEIIPPPAILDVKFPGFTNKIAFGESETRILTISNRGGSDLSNINILLSNNSHGAFTIDGDLSQFNLAPDASKTFNVIYKPDVKNFSDTLKKSEDNGEIYISSNVGNKTVPLNSSGVYTVSGASSLNVGDVAAGLTKVFRYPVRNNTLTAVTACLKLNGATEFAFDTGASTTRSITSGREEIFGITFKPKLNVYPKDYTDKATVGIIDVDGKTCKPVYDFSILGRGVKPLGIFHEN